MRKVNVITHTCVHAVTCAHTVMKARQWGPGASERIPNRNALSTSAGSQGPPISSRGTTMV